MEVRVEITAEDTRALLRHLARNAPPFDGRRRFWARVAAWLAVVTAFTWLYTATSLRPGYILSVAVGFVAGMVACFAWVNSWRETEPRPYGVGSFTIGLDANGLRLRSGEVETRIPRESVRRVDEGAEHLFIGVDGAPIVMVPKRAFATEDERRGFLAALRAEE
jgi:hypothetical protein